MIIEFVNKYYTDTGCLQTKVSMTFVTVFVTTWEVWKVMFYIFFIKTTALHLPALMLYDIFSVKILYIIWNNSWA